MGDGVGTGVAVGAGVEATVGAGVGVALGAALEPHAARPRAAIAVPMMVVRFTSDPAQKLAFLRVEFLLSDRASVA